MQYSKIVIHADSSEDLTEKVTRAIADYEWTARVEVIRVSAFVVILQWAVEVETFAGVPANTIYGNKDSVARLDENMKKLREYRDLDLDHDLAYEGRSIMLEDFYRRHKELNGDT